MAASEPPVVVTASRSAQGLAASPRASKAAAADEANSDVVVTGARIAGRDPYAARGDWNACTVNDPEQSLRGCRGAVGIGAKGQAGEAAASLSQGLALAWQNDWRGAIAAFDRAIALKPKSAFAYLNRGLAYQREGNLARAAADLDLAIKYAPYAARGYYNRGLLRRERGDVRGANADAARAAEMDSGYPDPVAPARR
jgi:tetratricopeptide (TPR) repeat protein